MSHNLYMGSNTRSDHTESDIDPNIVAGIKCIRWCRSDIGSNVWSDIGFDITSIRVSQEKTNVDVVIKRSKGSDG